MAKNIVHCLSTLNNVNNGREETAQTSVSFHPKELILAVGSGLNVKLWTFSPDNFKASCLLPISITSYDKTVNSVNSVAFHPGKTSPPVLATGSKDNTVRIWQVEPDDDKQLDSTCLTNLGTGHFETRDLEIHKHTAPVKCVIFHPTAPILASGSNNSVKLWSLNEDGSISKWLEDIAAPSHYSTLNVNYISVVFHPREPLLAIGSGSHDVNHLRSSAGAVEIRRLSSDGSKTQLTTTLDDGVVSDKCVKSIAFHPTAKPPVLAASFDSHQVKLWRLKPDASNAEHLITLDEQYNPRSYSRYTINCISFHPLFPILVTGSNYGTINIWRLNFDTLGANCLITLNETNGGHRHSITSLAFHPSPSIPFLASGSFDNTAKLWDCTSLFEMFEIPAFRKNSNAFGALTGVLAKKLLTNHHKTHSGSVVRRVAAHVMDNIPWASRFPFYGNVARRIDNLSRGILHGVSVSPLNPWSRRRIMLENSKKPDSPKSPPKKGGNPLKCSRRFKSTKQTKRRRKHLH